jgi:DNA-binding NarL/FixJ family response regulator
LLGDLAQALPVGARYITKSTITDMSQLVELIKQVRRFPLKTTQGSTNRAEGSLTDRQIEVLKLVADGMSTIQISQKLGVSEKAVEASISRLNSSLGISKSDSKNLRVQLVRAYFTLTGKKPPRE